MEPLWHLKCMTQIGGKLTYLVVKKGKDTHLKWGGHNACHRVGSADQLQACYGHEASRQVWQPPQIN